MLSSNSVIWRIFFDMQRPKRHSIVCCEANSSDAITVTPVGQHLNNSALGNVSLYRCSTSKEITHDRERLIVKGNEFHYLDVNPFELSSWNFLTLSNDCSTCWLLDPHSRHCGLGSECCVARVVQHFKWRHYVMYLRYISIHVSFDISFWHCR